MLLVKDSFILTSVCCQWCSHDCIYSCLLLTLLILDSLCMVLIVTGACWLSNKLIFITCYILDSWFQLHTSQPVWKRLNATLLYAYTYFFVQNIISWLCRSSKKLAPCIICIIWNCWFLNHIHRGKDTTARSNRNILGKLPQYYCLCQT